MSPTDYLCQRTHLETSHPWTWHKFKLFRSITGLPASLVAAQVTWPSFILTRLTAWWLSYLATITDSSASMTRRWRGITGGQTAARLPTWAGPLASRVVQRVGTVWSHAVPHTLTTQNGVASGLMGLARGNARQLSASCGQVHFHIIPLKACVCVCVCVCRCA